MTLDKQNKINFLINEEYQCITNEVFNKNICNFIIELSKNILKTKEARLYPDLMSFAYWCRSSNLNKYRAKYKDNNLRIMSKKYIFILQHQMLPILKLIYLWFSVR